MFFNTTLLFPRHCTHYLLKTKPHINTVILLFSENFKAKAQKMKCKTL